MDTELSVWNDAYEQCHQIITDKDKMVLYERYKYNDLFERDGVTISLSMWHPWIKVETPYRTGKAWHIRKLTVEDIICGNYEEKTK